MAVEGGRGVIGAEEGVERTGGDDGEFERGRQETAGPVEWRDEGKGGRKRKRREKVRTAFLRQRHSPLTPYYPVPVLFDQRRVLAGCPTSSTDLEPVTVSSARAQHFSKTKTA
jgi:hypothetical protein